MISLVLDYYVAPNTTDHDMIEFETGVVRTNSESLDSDQSIGISILLDDTEVWNTTVSFVVNSTEVNV
jgi:hypothetical protein